jgi:hypothetical protein
LLIASYSSNDGSADATCFPYPACELGASHLIPLDRMIDSRLAVEAKLDASFEAFLNVFRHAPTVRTVMRC